MHIDKEQVVDLLRSRGEHDKASTVSCALPRQVDTEADAGVLAQLDVNVSELAGAAQEREPDRGAEPV